MLRKTAAVLAFAFAVPSVALACSEDTRAESPPPQKGEQLAKKDASKKDSPVKKQTSQKNQ